MYYNKNNKEANDEVEELLRAAEDATLLKLNVNSHSIHASNDALHPELDQRFWALKSGSNPVTKPVPSGLTQTPNPGNVKEDEDDLIARFAALKASLPKPSTSAVSSSSGNAIFDGSSAINKVGADTEEEDEVEKVIRWAVDAARLDPSPPDDNDDSNSNVSDSEGDDSRDEDDGNHKKDRKGHCK